MQREETLALLCCLPARGCKPHQLSLWGRKREQQGAWNSEAALHTARGLDRAGG